MIFRLSVLLMAIWLMGNAFASDIPANQPIADQSSAENICDAVCRAQDCAWSGQWKKGDDERSAMCDCGPLQIRNIPGGIIRSSEDAKTACTEICTLNNAPWTGKWQRVPGAFDTCSCASVGDWCEPKKQ